MKKIYTLIKSIKTNAVLFLFMMFASFNIQAQTNLVPNSSFENSVTVCKPGAGIVNGNVSNWKRPLFHTGKPYLLTSCGNTSLAKTYNTPINKFGTQIPNTGTAYSAILMYKYGSNWTTSMNRSYLEVSLTTPLIAGKTYSASMYVSLADNSMYGVAPNNFGMYFSSLETTGAKNHKNLNYTPQVVGVPAQPLTNVSNWYLITGQFTATGGEQFLTIGNFDVDLQTSMALVSYDANGNAMLGKGPGKKASIYYIDDVQVYEVIAANPAPVASFVINPPTGIGSSSSAFTFTSTSINNPTSYVWNFGDASTNGSNSSVSHVFASGTYTVTLTATNAGGNNSISHTVVSVSAPVSAFTKNVASGQYPLTVAFTNTSTFMAGQAPTYSWNFGDASSGANNTSTLASPSHVFNTAGTFTITLTASNIGGNNSTSQTILVTVPAPVSNFTATPTSGRLTATGLSVTFTNTSSGAPFNSVIWDFGDGSPLGSGASIIHTYAVTSAGLHNAKLTVTNDAGSSNKIVVITLQKPAAATAFSGTPTTVAAGASVSFTNSTNTYGYTGYSYTWNFGDGGTSSAISTSHLYTTAGIYNVSLTSMSGDGGNNTLIKSGYIIITGAVAQSPTSYFEFTPTDAGVSPFSVSFTDLSTPNSNTPIDAITSWTWKVLRDDGISAGYTFAPGSDAHSHNPVIIFTSTEPFDGNDIIFDITLIVGNAGGNDTSTQYGAITVSPQPLDLYSRIDGNWEDVTTWSTSPTGTLGNTISPDNTNIILHINHVIQLNSYPSCNAVIATPKVNFGSALVMNEGATLDILHDFKVMNGAVAGGNFRIDAKLYNTITLNYNGDMNTGILDINLNSGSFDLNLGSTSIEASTMSVDNLKINLTGTADHATFDIEHTSEFDITGQSGDSTMTVLNNFTNGGGSANSGINFISKGNAIINLVSTSGSSDTDSLIINQNSSRTGAAIRFQLDRASEFDATDNNAESLLYDGTQVLLPHTTINQTKGDVIFNINDGATVTVGDGSENFIVNANLSSADITSSFSMGLQTHFLFYVDDVGVSNQEGATTTTFSTNDFIYNQINGTTANINLDGGSFTDADANTTEHGPTFNVANDFKITTNKSFNILPTYLSVIAVGDSSVFKNTTTGSQFISANIYGDVSASFGLTSFKTGKTVLTVGANASMDMTLTGIPSTTSKIVNNGTLILYGGNINGTLLTNNASIVYFNGSSSISGVTFQTLNINAPLILNGNSTVTNTLALNNNAAVNLAGYELVLGTGSFAGILSQSNGYFYGAGKFTRWMAGSVTDVVGIESAFPLGVNIAGVVNGRMMHIAKTVSGTAFGSVSVSFSDVTGITSGLNINDAGTIIHYRSNAHWDVSTTFTGIVAKFSLSAEGQGLGFASNISNLRVNLINSVSGTNSATTGILTDPITNRTLLTVANLGTTAVPTSFYFGSTSTGVAKMKMVSENVDFNDLNVSNVYPNPVSTNTYLNINSTTDDKINIQIIDITGKIIIEQNKALFIGINSLEINTSSLSVGAYLLKVVSNNNGSTVKRFIKI